MTFKKPEWRMGMLTPSSNTVLEPMVSAILRDLPDTSAHYARLPVTEISLAEAALSQFRMENHMAAAKLLADAKVHVIGWNGTSASWVGFAGDRNLCQAISQNFGVAATTAVLAINELMEKMSVERFALVTPYVAEVQEKIIEVYAAEGYDCVAESHFGEQINYAFAEIGDAALETAIRDVAASKPDAIVVMCTNLAAAHLAERLEAELGIPILDSVAAFVWKAASLCGIDTSKITGWGRLFKVVGDPAPDNR